MPRYENPILPGFYPDPSVCRVGSDYYLVTSSFAYFPGVPIFHSRDLVSWRQIGHCLDRPSQIDLSKAPTWAGIWAPTIRYHEGTFYMTTTNVSSDKYFDSPLGNFIVTASNPEGPWSDPIFIDQAGIDPSLFFDDDKSVYFTTSHGGAFQSRIDITTGKLLSEPQVVWEGSGGKHPEGPHLYKKDGYYYLLLSEGGTEYCHMITMARSKSPSGPFEPCPENPLLTHRSRMSPIQGVGHADLVDTPDGEWFAVALAYRPQGYPPCYHLGRETYLTPVQWPEASFPSLGSDKMIEIEHESPFVLGAPEKEPVRDDFDNPELSFQWNYLRNKSEELVSLSARPGFLRLRGAASSLGDVAAPAWLGTRQRHFKVRVATRVEFCPAGENEEAGVVVRMDEKHHYEIFVTRRNGAQAVVLRRQIGTLRAEENVHALSADTTSLVLSIQADETKYTFRFGPEEENLTTLGEGETRYLSTEVAGGFTGVMFALYATGNGAPVKQPADFDWFDYEVSNE